MDKVNEYHEVMLTQVFAKRVLLDFLLSVSLFYALIALFKYFSHNFKSLQHFVPPENLDKIVVIKRPHS
jgi:hypothetical protein